MTAQIAFRPDRSAIDTLGEPLPSAADGRCGDAYGEEIFDYFLGLERRRAERSTRSLLLLLVQLGPELEGEPWPLAMSTKVFTTLSTCIRDVDFMGWYRRGRVIGAVLTQGGLRPGGTTEIADRVTGELQNRLPAAYRPLLKVRVLEMPQGVRSS